LAWPWKKFEAMFLAYQKRKASERVEAVRLALVTGLWANSNYDGDGKGANPRDVALQEIEDMAATALATLYGSPTQDGLKKDIDKSDPFFAAMKVPGLPEEFTPQMEEEATKREYDIDQ
jgi:hypothetical protein